MKNIKGWVAIGLFCLSIAGTTAYITYKELQPTQEIKVILPEQDKKEWIYFVKSNSTIIYLEDIRKFVREMVVLESNNSEIHSVTLTSEEMIELKEYYSLYLKEKGAYNAWL